MKLTPMLEHYLKLKHEYPDALLFYRMGDFYELFFEDAELAARELSIALTSRNRNSENPVPMCGVPHHSVDAYLSQLVEKGFKIAVCDQVEDPKQAKGLVKRAVTRVITPGTLIEDQNLDPKVHNFIAALFYNPRNGSGGLAWADFSTGEWSGLQIKNEPALWQWAAKMQPRELLLAEGQEVYPKVELAAQVTHLPARAYFDPAGAGEKVLASQQTPSLMPLDLDDKPELVRALGALIAYLRQTQKSEITHMARFVPINVSRFMHVDEITERNLEIFRRMDGRPGPGTLRHALDHTVTPMGGRLLETRLRHPWRDPGPIEEMLDAVQYFFERDALRDRLRNALDGVYDLERLSTRISLNRTTPKDIVALKRTLAALPRVRGLFSDLGTYDLPVKLNNIFKDWDDLEDMCSLLERALADNPPPVITEGGLFRPGFNEKLDELMDLAEHGEAKMRELLETARETYDLPKLKIGFNKVFGYYFELSRAYRGEVPDDFVRRQTLKGSERYVTQELKDLEEKMLSAAERRKTLEYELFLEIRDTLSRARARFMDMSARLAELDYIQGLSEAARMNEWTRPRLSSELELRIVGGRHPVVEAVQGRANYIPNDLAMDERYRVLIVTGPNMAGKSTVLRQCALMCIMAQIGSFVSATSAEIGLADRVFSRVGASDNLAQGISTFMAEMMETARILRGATKKSLVILDEIGRGTSTFDGMALARAVVEELAARGQGGIRTLFATHYHELTALEAEISCVRNLNIAVKEYKGDIVFLRRLVPGPADKSYGIEVAKLAGVPRSVVARAKDILAELEKSGEHRSAGRAQTDRPGSLLPGMDKYVETRPSPGPEHSSESVLDEIVSLNADALTPLEALNLIYKWKKLFDERYE